METAFVQCQRDVRSKSAKERKKMGEIKSKSVKIYFDRAITTCIKGMALLTLQIPQENYMAIYLLYKKKCT